jgi:hypothetical protein
MSSDSEMNQDRASPRMALENLTQQEAEHLARELERIRAPGQRIVRFGKRIVGTALTLYALNAAAQGYALLHSPGLRQRVDALEECRAVAEELAHDRVFIIGNATYLKGKRGVNADFDRHMRHFAFYLREMKKSDAEFQQRLERIYNPFACLR